MLDAIALYLRYQSSHVISLRIVTTDLDLLSCTLRKDKTDSDLIRNAVLLWNNASSAKESSISIFASARSLFCCSEVDWWIVLFIWACSLICYSNYCLSWWFFLLLMNFCSAAHFGLREREKFQFSIFNLRCNHLWSY